VAELTRRGRRTRDRILRAAVAAFSERGFADTSVSDVLEASGTGKSQFYHYFDNKADLIREVLRFRRLESLPTRDPETGSLDSWSRIRSWFDHLLRVAEEAGCGGLDLIGAFAGGPFAAEERLDREVVRTTHLRRRLLHRGLRRMKRRGDLVEHTDPARLASFAAAAIEGGLHLSCTLGSTEPLRDALDETWARLRSYAADGVSGRPRSPAVTP